MSSLSPRPRTADSYASSNDHDDPLAELARIVAETSSFEPARPALRRVEPQVDFEAELFNELRASIDVSPAPAASASRQPTPADPYQGQGYVDSRGYPQAYADPDDAAFERALHPQAYPVAPAHDPRYADEGYAEGQYADPRYAEPAYDDASYADPRYADPNQAYADPAYDAAVAADPYQVDPYQADAYADDPRYARPAYDARDPEAGYRDAGHAAPGAEVSFDDFERDLAATTRQSVVESRSGSSRAEPAFDAYDDFDDYDRLPPVETELTASRADQGAIEAGGAPLAEAATDGRLGMKIAAAAMSLVVIGGLGFLGYRAFGPNPVANNGGAPPVIKAESQPAKVVPQGATPAKTESDRVAPANQQRIVARQEEPVDTVGNRQVRVVGPGAQPADGEDDAPRRVRTVVVRPDGTIVQPNAGAAPALPQAAAPAAVPAAPAATATPPTPAVLPPAPTEPAVAAVPAPGVPQPQPAPDRPAAQAEAPAAPVAETPAARPVPPPPAAVAATRPAPPAPQQRQAAAPAAAPLPLVPQASPAAAPATVAAVPAATPPASGGGAFVVQLSSQRSEADARRDFQRFQGRFGGLLAGKSADIQTADLGNRGVYYRLRVGPGGSREEAVRLCEQIKSQGGDCVVARR